MSNRSVLSEADVFTVVEKIKQYMRQGHDVTAIDPVLNA